MKNTAYFLVIGFLFFCTEKGRSQFFIQSGATLYVKDNETVTVKNGNWVNNGTFNAGSGTVVFGAIDGTANITIGGNSTTTFNHLTVNMSNYALQLLTNVSVGGNIDFGSGLFDLNGNNVTLGTDGQLVNESESSRMTGATGGEVVKTVALNAPVAVNPGNLGASITSAQNLGSTTFRRGHAVVTQSGSSSIARYFIINPTNLSSINATLRFNYLDAELGTNPEHALKLWRNAGTGWVYGGASSQDATQNVVELTNIPAFSTWTLSTWAILPVELLSFQGRLTEGSNVLTWQTANEVNVSYFDIERSTDGKTFEKIGETKAIGSNSTYQFLDQTFRKLETFGRLYYRLKINDLDGKIDYSKVIAIENGKILRGVKIYPNPVSTTLNIQTENKGDFQILNLLGQQVMRGQTAQDVDVSALPQGSYILKVGTEQRQFVKQ